MTDALRYIGFALVALWAVLVCVSLFLADLKISAGDLGANSFILLVIGSLVLVASGVLDKFYSRDER